MDFKRIERILIIAFLLLNIYLVYILWDQRQDVVNTNENQSLNLIQEIENNNISLPIFSLEKESLGYLQANKDTNIQEHFSELNNLMEEISSDGSTYTATLSEPLQLSSGGEDLTPADLAKIDRLVSSEEQIAFGEEYEYLTYQRNLNQVVYTQRVGDIPILDGTASIRFAVDSNQRIIQFEQTYAGNLEMSQDVSREIITDKRAVEILYQNSRIPSGARVDRPVLAYHRTLDLEEISMYIPVWYIQINETNLERVNAFDGSIIISSAPAQESTGPSPEEDNESETASDEAEKESGE